MLRGRAVGEVEGGRGEAGSQPRVCSAWRCSSRAAARLRLSCEAECLESAFEMSVKFEESFIESWRGFLLVGLVYTWA